MKSSGLNLSAVKRLPSADAAESPEHLKDPRWILVQRVAASESFKASTRLRDFLLYVTECAIRQAPEEATEQQIGINVFQRSPGYNSSEDSIVRTHARHLRQKLAEYFSTEGAAEEILIDIPKGRYLPVFHPRETDVKPASPTASPTPVEETPPLRETRPALFARWKHPKYVIVAVLVVAWVASVAVATLVGRSWPKRAPLANSALDTLWAPFLSGNPPLVIYSNALFLGDSKTGLRYPPPDATPDQLAPEHSVDTYTGIGELAAVYQLTRLFDAHQAAFVLKRSRLVTWDEARLTNLVFIGSPAENPSLKILPSTMDFTMVSGPDSAGVVNQHPRPGEPALFTRQEHPLTKDYAIVALLPGVEAGKKMLMLSGLTTLGTQAAVEYVCSPESVGELLKAASLPKGQIRPFEAVLEVSLGGGVPLQTRLVAIRVH